MSLKEHAERELRMAGLFDKDSDYDGALGTAVLELIDVFAKQGHSGFSASRTLQLFNKVAKYDCLMPLTGADEEWGEVGDGLWQNKRVSSVFKDKNGRAYYLDAIVWKTQKGTTWGGTTREGIGGRQFIKQFPFHPKTFTIDVIEHEVAKDDWEFSIKNMDDLKPVAEYYDMGVK